MFFRDGNGPRIQSETLLAVAAPCSALSRRLHWRSRIFSCAIPSTQTQTVNVVRTRAAPSPSTCGCPKYRFGALICIYYRRFRLFLPKGQPEAASAVAAFDAPLAQLHLPSPIPATFAATSATSPETHAPQGKGRCGRTETGGASRGGIGATENALPVIEVAALRIISGVAGENWLNGRYLWNLDRSPRGRTRPKAAVRGYISI